MAYRYLNNVLKHQRNYDDIVQYLKDGEKPRSRSITQDLLNDFKLEHGVLVYKPKNLTVVPPDDIQNVIKREYQDLSRSAGLGPPMLYSRIRDTYVGISRQKVADFLCIPQG